MDGLSYTKSNEGCTLTAIPDVLSGAEPYACGYGCTGPDIGPGTVWTQEQADDEAAKRYDLATTQAQNDLGIAYWVEIDEIRQAALIDMAYNEGGVGLSKFIHLLAAVRQFDWPTAHDEILNSKYAQQLPARAQHNAHIILTGGWPDGI